jgi:hypothetical protein
MAKVQPNTLLDNAWDRYIGEVEKIAQRTFDEIVKPMLDYANVRLTVDWVFGNPRLEEYIGDSAWRNIDLDEAYNWPMWRPAIDALQTDVPGQPETDLVYFMKSYTPEGAQNER